MNKQPWAPLSSSFILPLPIEPGSGRRLTSLLVLLSEQQNRKGPEWQQMLSLRLIRNQQGAARAVTNRRLLPRLVEKASPATTPLSRGDVGPGWPVLVFPEMLECLEFYRKCSGFCI